MKLGDAGKYFILCLLALTGSSLCLAEEGRGVLFQLDEYKPIYFAMGKTDTKIEVSFKVKLLDHADLYFGYSQLMIWDLFQESPYFRDINYNPEFFYRLYVNQDKRHWIDLSPFEHESNGKGGLLERAWDRLYVRYHGQVDISDEQKLFYSLKAWYGFDYNQYSQDLERYRGIWQIEMTLANVLGADFERSDLTFSLFPGGKSTVDPFHGGQELIWQVKTRRAHLPLFVVEIFHGWGEYLADYRDETFQVRGGFGF